MTPDEKLFDEVVSQALNVLRLSASQRAKVVKRLEAMSDEYVKALQGKEISTFKRQQIEEFLENAEKVVAKHYDILEDGVELQETAETVAAQMANALQVALGAEAVKLPKSSYFKSVASNVLIEGSPAADWWRGQAQDTQRRFSGAVRQGLLNAETNQQIIRRIVGTAEEPGAMAIARRNAASLVQTSVQAVANDARRATFDANDDVIKGLRQVSTLDGHTSPVCVAYSGASWNMKREPLNGSPPFNGGCPRHFNCRSLEVPITKTFRELGLDIDEPEPTTRASSEGQIAAGTSFDDFLRRKGQAYQDEVLGEGKADLWREGKITLRDLVNGEGRPLTLAELRNLTTGDFATLKPKNAPDLKLTDDIIEAAQKETKALKGLIGNAIGNDQNYVQPGLLRELDRDIKNGLYSFDDVAASYAKTRQLIRDKYGDTVTLYRANPIDAKALGGEKPLTVYMGDKSLVDKFTSEGRVVEAFEVSVDDILALNAPFDGYNEFIVKFDGLKLRGAGAGDRSGIFSPVTFANKFNDASVRPADIIDSFPKKTNGLIRKAEAEIERRGETKARFGVGKTYTPERLALHKRIMYEGVYGFDPKKPGTPKFYPGIFANAVKAKPKDGIDPTFTILGGRGGSGKSAFDGVKYPSAKVYDKDEVLLLDADHLKHMLPEYEGFNAFEVHEESSDLLKQVLDLARKQGLNVVLDGTLKSYDQGRKLIDSFARSGFRVEAHYMHLPRQEAAKRAVQRFLTDNNDGSGRYVPVKIVLDNKDNEENFMRLLECADAWSFRDNNVARDTPPRLIAERKARK